MTIPFASFLLAEPSTNIGQGVIAATTRAADRGQEGRIGLPGGKVDPGEDGASAAIRETEEEGWSVQAGSTLSLAHTDMVEGELIHWYTCDMPLTKKTEYKEQHRITPIVVSRSQIAASGYGNEWLDPDPFTSSLADTI